ncbi:LuxR C-terminal-related transcriptional regulator [Streptomyces virginiae]
MGTKAFRTADLSNAEGFTSAEAHDVVDQLLRFRLIRRVGCDSDRYEAVPPDRARALLLGEPVRELNRHTREVERLYGELSRLVPLYDGSLLERMSGQDVELIEDLDGVRELITELTARCRSEVLTSQPGGGRPMEVLAESAHRTSQLLQRGVRMRTIYQYAAQFDLPTVASVEDLMAQGAEVRTMAGTLQRLIVFDAKAALIEHHGAPNGAVLVHEPSVVTFMVATFERSWLSAAPFPAAYDRKQTQLASDDVRYEIMRLLVQGEEDKSISRQIGISTRTCQRHVSDIMQRIGARNRAHAGYLISELNLLANKLN